MGVEQPRLPAAQVQSLEEAVAVQHAPVVAAQHRLAGRYDTPARHGHPRRHHERSVVAYPGGGRTGAAAEL
ncbi:hypothetical protein GCM10010169_61230 [Micromonospora fulviviridis]|nr:hypothetical protein GCM10010169_61230 [Micromonospora fulviviridis]